MVNFSGAGAMGILLGYHIGLVGRCSSSLEGPYLKY